MSLEMDEGMLAELYAAPPKKIGAPRKEWTAKMDEHLLALWPIQRHADVARALGMCENVARRRYEELTGRHHGTRG